jgi:hypothetical protein
MPEAVGGSLVPVGSTGTPRPGVDVVPPVVLRNTGDPMGEGVESLTDHIRFAPLIFLTS